MNPGTLSIIIYIISITLVCSGWWDVLLQQLSLRRKVFVGGLTLFIVMSQVNLPVGQLTVNSGFICVAAVTCYSFSKTKTSQRLMLFSTITLSGAASYLIREMAIIDPVLLLLPAMWLQVMVIFMLVAMTVRGVWEGAALLSGGLTLGYTLSLLYHLQQMPVRSFGDPAFFDLLWVGFLGLIMMDGIARKLKKNGRLRLKRSNGSLIVASDRKSRYD